MRIEYTQQIDDAITDAPLEETEGLSIQDELPDETHPTMETWPRVIGIAMIINGFFTAILGTLELFVLPLIVPPYDESKIIFSQKNCFGAGLLAGFFMVLTGSSAVRSSISRRPTSVRKFFNLTLFTLLLYTGITVLLIAGYSLHWTDSDKYKAGSSLYEIHIFVTISTLFGFMFAIAAFIQYYEVVFCGQYQLCRRWANCLCPCCEIQIPVFKRSVHDISSRESLPI